MNEGKTDYRSMFDRTFLASFDLEGKDRIVTISSVEAGEIKDDKGNAERKPVISFEGKKLKLCCNKTNCKAIAGMYGNVVEAWVGKRITLYATVVAAFGSEWEAIRVRPTKPAERGAA